MRRAGRHRPLAEWKAMLLSSFNQGCLLNEVPTPFLLLIINTHNNPIPEIMICLMLGGAPSGSLGGVLVKDLGHRTCGFISQPCHLLLV